MRPPSGIGHGRTTVGQPDAELDRQRRLQQSEAPGVERCRRGGCQRRAVRYLPWCGDGSGSKCHAPSDGEIGMPGGAVRVLVVAAREDLQIAYEVRHSRRHAKPIRRATGGSRLLTSQDERQCRRINQHSPARSLALVRGARRHQFSHRLAACPPKPRSRFAARCSLDEVGKGNVGAIYSRDDTITGCFKTPVAVPPLPDQRTTPAGTPAKTGEQRRPPPSRPRRRGSSPPPWPHSLAPA